MIRGMKEYTVLLADDGKSGYIIGQEERTQVTGKNEQDVLRTLRVLWNEYKEKD